MVDIKEVSSNREELKKKLKSKINQKQNQRKGITKNKAEQLGDKLMTLQKFIEENNITSETPLTQEFVDKVKDIINIQEIAKILSFINNDSQINKETLEQFLEKLQNF